MASGETYHYQYLEKISDGFVLQAQPFLPEFSIDTGSEDGYIVDFNEGYVFDYANGGERKAFSGDEQFKITETEKKTYYLEMTIDDANGSISEAKIKSKDTNTGEGEGENTGFINLKNLSNIEGPFAGENKKIKIDMAELEGPSISKLYVRDNIHLWMRGFMQKGGAGHAPLKASPSESGNAMIEFRELLEDPREDNILDISTVGDSILFYVPSGQESSESQHNVSVEASDQQDNRITVTSSTGSNGDVTYSLYVPPCSCESSSG